MLYLKVSFIHQWCYNKTYHKRLCCKGQNVGPKENKFLIPNNIINKSFTQVLASVSENQRRMVAIFQFGNSEGAEPSWSSDRYKATSKSSLRRHIKKTLEKMVQRLGFILELRQIMSHYYF